MRHLIVITVLATTFVAPASAEAACTYVPGGDPAKHTKALEEMEDPVLVTLPGGTRLQTDSGSRPGVRQDVGCLKEAHEIWVDRVTAVEGVAYEGLLKGCLNDTFVIGGVPVPPRPKMASRDWIDAFILASPAVANIYGGHCDGSVSWQLRPDGTVELFETVYDERCACRTEAFVPPNQRGEDFAGDFLAANIRHTPFEGLVLLAKMVLADEDHTVRPAWPDGGTSPQQRLVMGGPPPTTDPITPDEFVARLLAGAGDDDNTGLGDRVDNSRWETDGIVTWYHTGDCEETPRFAGAVGGAVWAFGTSHVIAGADLEVGIQQNDWRVTLGATGGADVLAGTWGIVPHAGPEFRVVDRKVDIWVGGDVVAGFGPDWVALGAAASVSVEGQVSPSVSLGARAWAGGMGGISGCNSGSLVGIRAGVTWKFPGN